MDNPETEVGFRVYEWQTRPELEPFTASTTLIPYVFYHYTPETLLKMGADRGEAAMTQLAHEVLGPVVPSLEAFVSISSPRPRQGILISLRPGVPLVELWAGLGAPERTAVKGRLAALLVRMRSPPPRLDYYGRPSGRPYVTVDGYGRNVPHAHCLTRSEWDASRVAALEAREEAGDDRRGLERVQCGTGAGGGVPSVDSPVLTHGDLSDRNILVDPDSLEITGLVDWGMANVAPAYFEYVSARLSPGHEAAWREEVLEVLREVLRIECEREVVGPSGEGREGEGEEMFEKTLTAWNAFVGVERSAQGYSGCHWTFEGGEATSGMDGDGDM